MVAEASQVLGTIEDSRHVDTDSLFSIGPTAGEF